MIKPDRIYVAKYRWLWRAMGATPDILFTRQVDGVVVYRFSGMANGLFEWGWVEWVKYSRVEEIQQFP